VSSKRWFGGRAYHSISSLAKEKGVRRKYVSQAIESGALKTRRLEGRKRDLILEQDAEVWWNSLPEANSAAGDKPRTTSGDASRPRPIAPSGREKTNRDV
jgi:hypothetical protein